MKKNSIFQKIDAFYTDIVKKIIGDIPLDGDANASNNQKRTTPLTKVEVVKNTFIVAKTTFLNLGKPDEKELLYKEVVKREKREAKELKQAAKAKTTVKKSTTPKKKTSTASAKKSAVKKTSTTTTKKEKATGTKKTVAKKSSTTQKEATKKSPAKKSVTSKKTTTKKEKASTTKSKSTTKPTTKKTTTSKTKAAPKTSKRAEKIALYAKDIKKHYGEVDEDFLTIIVKNLGPSIYRKDAELVSCSDATELNTVRKNFLMKKLGIDASKAVLDAAIQDVCEELKGVRTKYRATFYYRLAKKFKKESTLS